MNLKIKEFFQKSINFFGYKVSKIKNIEENDLDKIIKYIMRKKRPIIFDVGANKGQSIKRFKKIYNDCEIHSFEPGNAECDEIRSCYKSDNSIFINNVGVSDRKSKLEFNINAKTTHSSFKKLLKKTTWIKKRSKVKNIKNEKYTVSK
jgi:FkbM family methyltransferase